MEIHRIGEYKIPNFVTDINLFEIFFSNLKKMDIEEQQSKPQNDISILKLCHFCKRSQINITVKLNLFMNK